MKEFIANCCLFLEFLNWNVLWKWSKFSITFVHLYQQVKLVYTYERFSVLSIKSLNQTFLPFLDRKPWWEKHILFVKQTIPHQFTLTLKGVCWLLKSNPDGARSLYWSISSSIPRAKANLPQLLIFLTFLKKKTCHIVILKVVRCSKLLIGFTQTFSKA